MSNPHFIVHDADDTVGVVVVEGVTQGMELDGWVMATNARIRKVARTDIPLGHKIALRPVKAGETIFKYGHDIGKAVADIAEGDHAHVQNVKTKKW